MSTTSQSGPNGQNGQEERESLLSAMYDGEVTAGEGDLLARRLARDPALRRRWSRYALTGAVLRGEQEFVASSRFGVRLAAAIAAEPAHALDESADARVRGYGNRPAGAPAGSGPARTTWARWWRPVAGVGVAATVAAASILILRLEPGTPPLAAQLPAKSPSGPAGSLPVAVVEDDPYIYSTPRSTPQPHPFSRDRAVSVPAAQLANYVVAHSEYSNPLGRRNLLSALMAGESFGREPDPAAPQPASVPALADGSALDEPAGAGDAAR